MRVAAVMQMFTPVLGGAQRQLEAAVPSLAQAGYEMHVITRRPAGAPAHEQLNGAAIHRVSPFGHSGRHAVAFMVRGTARAVALRPAVVHAHDLLSPSTIGLTASAILGVPFVVKVLSTGLGGDVDRLQRKPLGRQRLAVLARRVDKFVCLSRDVERELAAHGVSADRMARIPNGVDADRFRPPTPGERRHLRQRIGASENDQVAIYCGRFYETKRLDVLVEAMRSAPGKLLLVGEGPANDVLERLIDARGFHDRVILWGRDDDTPSLYRAADVYVSASRSEGMSGSALEAMATGLPVVAADASGMVELLGSGAGVILREDGPESFARELRALEEQPEMRHEIGRRGRERIIRDFTIAANASRLASLYAEVASTPRPRA